MNIKDIIADREAGYFDDSALALSQAEALQAADNLAEVGDLLAKALNSALTTLAAASSINDLPEEAEKYTQARIEASERWGSALTAYREKRDV